MLDGEEDMEVDDCMIVLQQVSSCRILVLMCIVHGMQYISSTVSHTPRLTQYSDSLLKL